MGDAYQASHYSSSLIHEHTEKNHDGEVLKLVFDSGIRSWRKSIARIRTGIRNWIYPARIEALWIFVGGVSALHYGSRSSYDLVSALLEALPDLPEYAAAREVLACFLAGTGCWFSYVVFMRITLRVLLTYQGFLFEGRGTKISTRTKLWAILLKLILKSNPPSTFSFQNSLPRLPVPKLNDTMERYLRSVRPLLDDEAYEKICEEAKEFENGIGKKLQRYLILKSWWSTNYVSDWWETYAYHRSRNPLITYSNIYGTDNLNHPSKNQAARTANLVYQSLQFRRQLCRQQIPAILVQGMVPLCSWQLERMFNTARIPGIEGDKIVHHNNSDHIVVLHKGCYYKVPIYHNGRLLNAPEIEFQLNYIMNLDSESSHAEKYLSSLTAWNRTKWAETRDEFFAKGVNKISLDCIESSAFFLNLHDEPYDMDLDDPAKMSKYAKECLHGRIYDIWFDKSFCLGAGTNARFSMNAEHSWADAPTLGVLFETVLFEDMNSYDEKGNLKGSMKLKPPAPNRLQWEFKEELVKNIDEAYQDALKIVQDVDHYLFKFHAFGKGFIKTCRLSPDAFIQMALQLAYYREFNKFCLTYEASMTRLYRDGRTETVRSCTIESCTWVRAMENQNSSSEERVKLLQEACNQHQKGYLNAMAGKGIDRHLFCLFIVSKYLEVDSPFLKEVLSEPWLLSTSQTPHGQLKQTDLNKFPQLKGSGGGFGPVYQEGYGTSYIVSGEDSIFFHMSSSKSCSITNTQRFAKRLESALLDIKGLFDKYNAEQRLKK